MSEGSDAAFPYNERNNDDGSHYFSHDGLTKREYFAGLAMQAIVTGLGRQQVLHDSGMAKFAVVWADELISALNAEQQP